MDEAELIERARRGEPAAWEALVETHQEAVFRLAYLMIGNADEAADVAQETFIRAAQALDRFDTQRPLRPYLLRIAANLSRNFLRDLRRAVAALRRAGSSMDDAGRLAGDWTGAWSDSDALWQAVRQLRRTDQEIIYLRFFLDLTEGETARALEVATGTVKSRLSRALGRLRPLLAAEFQSRRKGMADD